MKDAAESRPEIQDVPSMILDLRQEILQLQNLLSGMDGTLSSHTASIDSLRCTVDSVFVGARSRSKLSTGLDRCMESTSEGPEEQDPAFSSFAVNINTEVNERLDTVELVQAPQDPPALLPLPGVIGREGPDDSSLVHQHITSATPLEKDNEIAPVKRRNSQKKSLESRQSRDSEQMQARKSDGVRKIRSLESGPRKLRYGMVEELQEETARQLLKNSHDLHASDGGPPGMLVKSNTMKSVKQAKCCHHMFFGSGQSFFCEPCVAACTISSLNLCLDFACSCPVVLVSATGIEFVVCSLRSQTAAQKVSFVAGIVGHVRAADCQQCRGIRFQANLVSRKLP
ncbi:unnamed protein product [Symbiodinium sp. CCMP2456]|nr:unnamed protein product [Symbiodinium sp. CCMP2456]